MTIPSQSLVPKSHSVNNFMGFDLFSSLKPALAFAAPAAASIIPGGSLLLSAAQAVSPDVAAATNPAAQAAQLKAQQDALRAQAQQKAAQAQAEAQQVSAASGALPTSTAEQLVQAAKVRTFSDGSVVGVPMMSGQALVVVTVGTLGGDDTAALAALGKIVEALDSAGIKLRPLTDDESKAWGQHEEVEVQ